VHLSILPDTVFILFLFARFSISTISNKHSQTVANGEILEIMVKSPKWNLINGFGMNFGCFLPKFIHDSFINTLAMLFSSQIHSRFIYKYIGHAVFFQNSFTIHL
jgi:hypothetical protein